MVAFSLHPPSAFYTACTHIHSHPQLTDLLTYVYIYKSVSLVPGTYGNTLLRWLEKNKNLQTEIRGAGPWVWGPSLGESVGQSHYTHVTRNSEHGKSQVSEELGKSEKPETLNAPRAVCISRNYGYCTTVAGADHSSKG